MCESVVRVVMGPGSLFMGPDRRKQGAVKKGFWGSLGNPRPAPPDEEKTWASNRCPKNGLPEGSKGENLMSGASVPILRASI